MHIVSHPIQNVDSPIVTVRRPMHYVCRPILFIFIRWCFSGLASAECPISGEGVSKWDALLLPLPFGMEETG